MIVAEETKFKSGVFLVILSNMWLMFRHHFRIVFKEIEDIHAGLWNTKIRAQVTGELLDQVRHLGLSRLHTVDENWIGWKRDPWRFRPRCRGNTRLTVSSKGYGLFHLKDPYIPC